MLDNKLPHTCLIQKTLKQGCCGTLNVSGTSMQIRRGGSSSVRVDLTWEPESRKFKPLYVPLSQALNPQTAVEWLAIASNAWMG